MLRISGINFQQNYRVNPLYEKTLKDYKKYNELYEDLESKINSEKAEKKDFREYEKAEKMKLSLENQLRSIPKISFGGNLDKQDALSEVQNLHRINYLA